MVGVAYRNRSPYLKLSLEIMEDTLSDQLYGLSLPRLRHLQISGQALVVLRPGALSALQDCRQIVVEVSGTQVQDIPSGFFASLSQAAHLSIDLRDNALLSLSPLAFYGNNTPWEHVGTKLIAGGLLLHGNPWVCDCGLVWVGQWLRRWLRESLQLHTAPLDAAQHMALAARGATCTDPRTGGRIPLLDLYLSCYASALSRAPRPPQLLASMYLVYTAASLAAIFR